MRGRDRAAARASHRSLRAPAAVVAAVLVLATCGRGLDEDPAATAAMRPLTVPGRDRAPSDAPVVRSQHPGAHLVGLATTPGGGTLSIHSDGTVTADGAADLGSAELSDRQVAVGIAAARDASGYWVAATDGQVYGFGDVPTATATIDPEPLVGIAAGEGGFWTVDLAGRVRSIGVDDHGSAPLAPGQRAAAIASTPDGAGYWVAATDGTVWGFGDATGFDGRAAPSPAPVSGLVAHRRGVLVLRTDGTTEHLGRSASPAVDGVDTDGELAIGLTAADGRLVVATRPRRTASVAAAGDVLIHAPVSLAAAGYGASNGQGYDFAPMFAPIADVIGGADLAICHLEVPLSRTNDDLSYYPVFNAPNQLASDLAEAGFDTCSTASNHSLDRGPDGVAATLDALDEAGLSHAGTARSPLELLDPSMHDVGGIRIGHLSFTYGFNGLRRPPGQEWMADLLDEASILERAALTRASGAEFVVVSLHWGAEYRTEPTDVQVELARRLLESPHIDLLLGHHAHVVQPIERIDDEFVVYGMGNLLANQCCARRQDGVVVTVGLAEDGHGRIAATGVAYRPTRVEHGSFRILPTSLADDPATPEWKRAELAASADRTHLAIGQRGAFDQGVRAG